MKVGIDSIDGVPELAGIVVNGLSDSSKDHPLLRAIHGIT